MRLNTVKYLTTLVVIVGALQVNTALAQMDHGPEHQDMGQMQGGSAPADARDPHAYSDGYTLTEGPYAQPGPRQLKLADEHAFWSVLGDRLEYQEDSDSTVYDIQAWYGTTYNRFVIKAEGDIADGTLEESSTELLWGHALNAYFDTQFGVRLDQYDEGKDRQWLAIGMQGLAPYWFELDVTAYVGDDGRTALSAEAEYELLLTQRLILQPRAELNLYGKDDLDNRLGSGLSDLALGLRLRYEFSRQFSPYIGVEWTDTYGDTADYRRAAGQDTSGTQFVAGLRFWF
ncbi:putative copper resistance protein B [gamma proteobacterium BDW918]|uniref:Copper resistance protein B n=1 Tax=Spongiibacter pelagi TaxID=2760804 RepID=A0A927C5C5_9GAMM|nr:copper resistance protein B [Spongiibacter pelagi]EIF42879.1 putative copper resistance protein B [gamma proteobacterium BDW918]MBD2860302.1 copper resistance protein B [Spongiibacter pelagi]